MKHLLIIAGLLFSLATAAEIPNLQGVWKDGTLEMTFLQDTLLIDEIDVEGDEYTYSVDSTNNVITVTSPFYSDTILIKIVKITPKELHIYYIGDDEDKDIIKLKRKKVQIPTMGF